jgi:hypothetical protein
MRASSTASSVMGAAASSVKGRRSGKREAAHRNYGVCKHLLMSGHHPDLERSLIVREPKREFENQSGSDVDRDRIHT